MQASKNHVQNLIYTHFGKKELQCSVEFQTYVTTGNKSRINPKRSYPKLSKRRADLQVNSAICVRTPVGVMAFFAAFPNHNDSITWHVSTLLA